MTTRPLTTALTETIDTIRDSIGDCHGDPLADVRVLSGDDANQINPDCAVVIAYDGAGYHYLSTESDSIGTANMNRERLISIGEHLGYEGQILNAWSIGFIL
jgi:hypothetical protein